jgi:hypothetical protein
MKVLIWQSYGNVEIYEAFVHDKDWIDKIKNLILDISELNYPRELIEELHGETFFFGDILDWVSEYTEDDESYERFEIAEVRCL